MGDPVSTFERFLMAEHQARNGRIETRAAAKAMADHFFRRWQSFPQLVRQRVEEHFKPGCTPVSRAPHLPDDADATLRDLAAAAYQHPYNSVEHQRSWLVVLDYEEEHCPARNKNYSLLRAVCERLIARLAHED